MTLPDERYRAVVQTQEFLVEILTTPRVPKRIKEGARAMLRHYPSEYDMKRAAENCPDVFVQKMEPLYRMVKQHQQEKDENENRT